MKAKSPWMLFTSDFRQSYDGAYAYLDKCGIFMTLLRERFGFYPTESLPTGCQLELPDKGLILRANTNELTITQDGRFDNKQYFEIVEVASEAACDLFEPFEVYQNCFSTKYILPQSSIEAGNNFSLRFWGNEHESLSRLLALQPTFKEAKFGFKSGSYELDLQSQPVAIGLNSRSVATPQNRISPGLADHLKNIASAAGKAPFDPGYSILLTLELVERKPANNLKEHLDLLSHYLKLLLSEIPS